LSRHDHHFRPISLSLDWHTPTVFYSCKTCVASEVRCVLCVIDGNRRKHRTQHSPTSEKLRDTAKEALAKALVEIESIFGPLSADKTHFGDRKSRPCWTHDESHWYTTKAGNVTCDICHPSPEMMEAEWKSR